MTIRKRLLKKVAYSNSFARLGAITTGLSLSEIKQIRDKVLSSSKDVHLRLVVDAMGSRSNLTFVQVGANDGKTGDPIFSMIQKYGGRALLIEPQSWLIDELRRNYDGFSGDLVIENKAVSTETGSLPFYILRNEYWDTYINRVGRHPSAIFSPDRSQLLGRIGPRLGLDNNAALAAIECIEVPAERLEVIMDRNGFLDADVIQIDCEGWDFEVIKSLGIIRPPVINFESFNLSDEAWCGFQNWCLENDYGYIKGTMDTLAVRGFPDKITF